MSVMTNQDRVDETDVVRIQAGDRRRSRSTPSRHHVMGKWSRFSKTAPSRYGLVDRDDQAVDYEVTD